MRIRPGTPLFPVYRAKITVFVCPFIPYGYFILMEIPDIGVASQEPQQFVDDGLEMALFGCHQRKAVGQVEAHLVAEYGKGARSGPVGFPVTLFQYVPHEFEVLMHGIERRGMESTGIVIKRGARV